MAGLSKLERVMFFLDDGVFETKQAKFETEPAKHRSACTDLTFDELKNFVGKKNRHWPYPNWGSSEKYMKQPTSYHGHSQD